MLDFVKTGQNKTNMANNSQRSVNDNTLMSSMEETQHQIDVERHICIHFNAS